MPKQEADSHIPAIRTLPPTIMSLHHPCYADLNEELKLECKWVFKQKVMVTQAEADYMYLEQSTRFQSQSLTLFSHRKGRITVSKFGSVLDTNLFSSAVSCDQSPQASFQDFLTVSWMGGDQRATCTRGTQDHLSPPHFIQSRWIWPCCQFYLLLYGSFSWQCCFMSLL